MCAEHLRSQEELAHLRHQIATLAQTWKCELLKPGVRLRIREMRRLARCRSELVYMTAPSKKENNK